MFGTSDQLSGWEMIAVELRYRDKRLRVVKGRNQSEQWHEQERGPEEKKKTTKSRKGEADKK